ncbi:MULTISPECIES: hypothetical protein [Auritidibacter]|uniref:Uncharacterized protein n=1 Tax=Auritidibacter ignavus TaxID=678932 RepID=A0AAJ6DBU4_9MICC|nr:MULTISPECIES: hypothetical protein [Auritidibacter]NIH71287.1 hypothetical protein [Auritidibacter ignavus]PXA81055.1 hypothetical protein DCC25_04230 [Auritidibacter sp. NML120636]RMX23534.1 hypothetical protein DYI20_04340 [Auritidibacter ignavus]WGH81416.1 hypothetical protein QDX25_11635 [Auritidibacter ignavus]WGH83674.1 hypothetical protein QDX20_10490 [Auritidibacter ignavus]
MSIVQIPLRLAAGAFVLNSGLNKRKISDEQAEGLRDMAARGVPAVKDMSGEEFKKFITTTEIGVGASLLVPMVPGWVAGAALSAFSGGLVSMYLNTPEMTESDGIRPSESGTAVAKDILFLGSGIAITLDSLFNRGGKKKKAAAKRAKKISAAKDDRVEAIQEATDQKVEAIEEARQKFKADRKQARQEQKEALKKAAKKAKKGSKKVASNLNLG